MVISPRPHPELRSDQQTFHFLFATANDPLAEVCLNNDRLSAITFNTSLITHVMGDIGYFLHYEKESMGTVIFVRYSKRYDFSFGSI